MIRDCNGGHITDPVEKANILNNYYASVFSDERAIPVIKPAHIYMNPSPYKLELLGKG